MAEQISADVIEQVRQMLTDAVRATVKDARANAAGFIDAMATPAAVASLELAANPSDEVAGFVIDGIKIQAIQMAAETGLFLSQAADAGLQAAIDVGIRVLSRVIRGV